MKATQPFAQDRGTGATPAAGARAGDPPGTFTTTDAVPWKPVDPRNHLGLEMFVVWGNPNEGASLILQKYPAGMDSGWHWHTAAYQGVVIQGKFTHTFEGAAPQTGGPGSVWSQPARQVHRDKCEEGGDGIIAVYFLGKLDFNPVHKKVEDSSQSSHPAGSAWAREKRFADVLGRRMAYIERGMGHPIVFLHGNPTSSFLWRAVLPHVEASGRQLIAPDLIGMGDSDKIPAGAEPDRYRFASHARYLDAFIDEVVGMEPLTLVLHDWGGALGFDWAYRHQQRVRAMAYMETFVAPLTLEDLPESFRPTLKAVRSSAGEALVLDENMFIEKMLPSVMQRTLSADEMAEYRRPFLEAADDRWPTLQWAREVPLSGEPADVYDRIAAYSTWLKTASLPKLFIDAEPGVFITGRIRKLASSFPNQHRVVVRGLHFVQEDSPDDIGPAIAGWLQRI